MTDQNTLNLYDIMAQDVTLYAKLVEPNHVKLEVHDENDILVYCETSHIYAWDSLVSFAKQVLRSDARIREAEQAFDEDEYYKGFGK